MELINITWKGLGALYHKNSVSRSASKGWEGQEDNIEVENMLSRWGRIKWGKQKGWGLKKKEKKSW